MDAISLSPVHDLAGRAGATMAVEQGWMMPQSYGRPTGESIALGLLDESNHGKLIVQGLAGGVVSSLAIEPPREIGAGAANGSITAYRLRPDQLFVMTPPGEEAAVLAALSAADTGAELVTVTDVTHGRARFRLIGHSSAELLSRLCGLDFHGDSFPNLSARQTSVAKTTQLIIRDDLGDGYLDDGRELSFLLIGARSLGAYLWETLLESGAELGIVPLGMDDYPIGK